MTQDDLREFVREARAKGLDDVLIVGLLKSKGWSEKLVYEALGAIYEAQVGRAIPHAPRKIEAARETFLYLLGFVAMGAWVLGIGNLLVEWVEVTYRVEEADSIKTIDIRSIAGWLATVLVGFPVAMAANWLIRREQVARPDKEEGQVRLWLGNAGLLGTGLVLLWNVVWGVSSFLMGEMDQELMLKKGVMIVLAAGMMGFYGKGLGRKEELPSRRWMLGGFGVATVASVLGIAAAFDLIGAPQMAWQRAQDVATIKKLHAAAMVLAERPSGMSPVEQGSGIESRVIAPGRFQLCAVFQAAEQRKFVLRPFWRHPAGRHCYVFDEKADVPVTGLPYYWTY